MKTLEQPIIVTKGTPVLVVDTDVYEDFVIQNLSYNDVRIVVSDIAPVGVYGHILKYNEVLATGVLTGKIWAIATVDTVSLALSRG